MAKVGIKVQRFRRGGDLRDIGERFLYGSIAVVASFGRDSVVVSVGAAHNILKCRAGGGADVRSVSQNLVAR